MTRSTKREIKELTDRVNLLEAHIKDLIRISNDTVLEVDRHTDHINNYLRISIN